jgi:hypothetical protein
LTGRLSQEILQPLVLHEIVRTVLDICDHVNSSIRVSQNRLTHFGFGFVASKTTITNAATCSKMKSTPFYFSLPVADCQAGVKSNINHGWTQMDTDNFRIGEDLRLLTPASPPLCGGEGEYFFWA